MLNKNIEKSLDDIINYIINSKEYIKCIEIKKKMSKNKELTKLIEEIKELQKKYVKENKESIKEKLDSKEKELNGIPIYVEYNNNLEVVNNMINLVKDELNDYFYKLLNEKK